MIHKELSQEIASRIPLAPAAFDALDEGTQQVFVTMAQQALEELEKERKRAEEAEKKAEDADREKHDALREAERIERLRKEDLEDHQEDRERLIKEAYAYNHPEQTHTLKDLEGDTKSRLSIKRCREYVLYRHELEDAGVEDSERIRLLQAREDEYFAHLNKVYSKEYRLKKRGRAIVKDRAKRAMHRHQGIGAGSMVDSEDLPPTDLYELECPVSDTASISVYVPLKEVIEERCRTLMEEAMSRNHKMKHPMLSLHINTTISALNRHECTTRNVFMIDDDNNFRPTWFEEFLQQIIQRYIAIYNDEKYKDPPKGVTVYTACMLSINTFEIRSIKKWVRRSSEDIAAMEPTIKGLDFTLFLAKDEAVPCVEQVFNRLVSSTQVQTLLKARQDKEQPADPSARVERVMMPYCADKTLYQNLDAIGVVYDVYTSRTNPAKLSRFRNFDLLQKGGSTGLNDVKIVEWDSHVGLIEDVVDITDLDHTLMKRRNIISHTSKGVNEVVFDIEAYVDNKRFVPYLVCMQEMNGSWREHTVGEGCVNATIQILEKHYNHTEKVQNIVWAWNGSGFDYQYLVPAFIDAGYDVNHMEKGSSIIYSKCTSADGSMVFHLKDMVLFLPMPLSRAASAFEVAKEKGEFPYSIVTSFKDLDEYKQWFEEREVLDISDESQEQEANNHIRRITKRIKIEPTGEQHHVLDKAIEYCYRDVEVSRLVWLKYKRMLKETLGFAVPSYVITGSQLAFEMMRSMMPVGLTLALPVIKREYDFFRDSLYGGRVFLKPGLYGNLIFIDARSLYPTAMSLESSYYPFGAFLPTETEMEGKLGVYACKLTMVRHELYLNYTVRREGEKLENDLMESFEGVYNSVDIQTARDQGYRVTIKHGYYWEESSNTHFREFVHKLYAIKRDSLEKALQELAKLELNAGGYGKFVQRAIDQLTYMVSKAVEASYVQDMDKNKGSIIINGEPIKGVHFENLDENYSRMVVPIEASEQEYKYPTYIGSFITAYARRFMYESEKKIRETNPRLEVVYSDTDSLMILESSLDDPEAVYRLMGKELGQFGYQHRKSDGFMDSAVIVGRKMYGCMYMCEKDKIVKEECHVKGVPKSMVNYNTLEKLLKNDRIEFNFKLFKKTGTGVDYIDSKKSV